MEKETACHRLQISESNTRIQKNSEQVQEDQKEEEEQEEEEEEEISLNLVGIIAMAESILFNVAASLVTKLGSPAITEFQLFWSFHDDLDKLKQTILAMEAVLHDAEKQQSNSHAVKNWISRVKEAFYDVDDLIDEYTYETLRLQVMADGKRWTKEVRKVFSLPRQIEFRFQMSHKIKDIREKLKAIDDDKNQFHLSECMINTRDDELRKRRETSSFICDDDVVGRDGDKKAIIDYLLNTYPNVKENVAVIAIVGMGGLGKTALAQSVYNNEGIRKHFELTLWVCISDDFDVKVIVEKILESATKHKSEILQMDLLQSELRKNIDGKKYLLIMDDVWNEDYEKWVTLKRLLMGGASGSRILITTRHRRVAETFDTTSYYALGELDDKNAWLLFKKMAFGGEEPKKELVDIGKEIVVKLKGLPLAIRTIGRLLYAKKPEHHLWSTFKENELSRVLEQREETQFMLSILELSYNHLPSNLKQCFLYCALFPKDYDIQKDEVIRQWMAHGFVQSTGTIKPNDIGEDYFMELLSRSFFQDVTRNEMGIIIYCKMHDLIHDLACSIVEDEYVSMDVKDKLVTERTRHILILKEFGIKLESLKLLFKAKNLKTLIIDAVNEDCQKVVNLISTQFLCLRTLKVEFCYTNTSKVLPSSIGKLKHLRYLRICQRKLEFLPNSITKLYNLEILILDWCECLQELPRDAKNWMKLRYLSLDRNVNIKFLPDSIAALHNLETLILDGCQCLQELPRDAKNWKKLRYLSLVGNKNIKFLPDSIGALHNLETLILDGCQCLQELPREAKNWMKLRYLSLVRNENIKFLPDFIAALHNLETLILQDCSELRELPKDIKKCVNLKHLNLSGCTNLTHMPKGLGELTSLQTMNLFVLKKDIGCDLSELNRLDKLEGSLTIEGLEVCTFDVLEKSLPLKLGVQELELVWNYSEDQDMNIVLDNECKGGFKWLQPHSNLRTIDICGYPEVRLCDWLSSNTFVHLVSIRLSYCFKLQALPQFDQFPFLKYLTLQSLPNIEYIDNNEYPSSSMFFPSLEELSIVEMLNLKGWWKGETSLESSPNNASFPIAMSRLCKLEIDACPHLASFPWHALLKSLSLHAISSQLLNVVFERTANHCVEECFSTFVSFDKIDDLEFLPEGFFYHFTNLEDLEIKDCKNLQMSSALVQHPINSLVQHPINDVLWKEFRSLRLLYLEAIPKLEYLPNGMQHVTTLERISIISCPNLITLPEWIGDFTSLLDLMIMECPKLTSLPERIHHLPSLQDLHIRDCPKLKERYEREKGEDWPKISHIPYVSIR
ncbi:putative disease resistance protein RGA4 [Cucurbita moschata]|uniref:Disease resistance protein RGA4 n=1 Tax=Cucurbita moschata TaxID=3662 RepID=A0A6J1FNX2_CUCMO|nr:putative disease resistance protein RGA4 [Cucurbita moschata]